MFLVANCVWHVACLILHISISHITSCMCGMLHVSLAFLREICAELADVGRLDYDSRHFLNGSRTTDSKEVDRSKDEF